MKTKTKTSRAEIREAERWYKMEQRLQEIKSLAFTLREAVENIEENSGKDGTTLFVFFILERLVSELEDLLIKG